jgi:hypothetical protein
MVSPSGFDMRRREVVLAALAMLSGCGGVDSGGTGTGMQATFASGPISGFGSIIVNGVHYDDSAATVQDDDDRALTRADLKLGMQTEVLASPVTVTGGVSSATASIIRSRSAIVGPIDSIDATHARLQVLGQTVSVVGTTVFDAALAQGLVALTAGDVVEVHAVLDMAAGRYIATRIERRVGATAYKLRGVVGALSLADRTITLGSLVIDWSAVPPADPAVALAVGSFVRVKLAITPAAGVWKATALVAGLPVLADRERAEVEGRVSAFTSATAFAVNGITVDASAASYPNGSTGLAPGAKVQVQGSIRNGVLVAAVVKVESEDAGPEPFELSGTIEALDAVAQTFVVRSITVVWSSSTSFGSSAPGDLSVGRKVEAKGRLSSDGTRVEATTVHVEL